MKRSCTQPRLLWVRLFSAIETRLRRKRVRSGGTSKSLPSPSLTNEEKYIKQHTQRSIDVNNLLDRRNALNVYQATGSASDDGFYGNDVYSESFVELYGDDPDGDGVTDYEEMYRAVNIDNDESYRVATGDNLISAPRQVFLGFAINF